MSFKCIRVVERDVGCLFKKEMAQLFETVFSLRLGVKDFLKLKGLKGKVPLVESLKVKELWHRNLCYSSLLLHYKPWVL